jgi:methylmalonyl-CoA mutase
MADQTLPLAADFPDQDEARWRALAESALKGAPWERLVNRTLDGAPIQPLYRAPDFASAENAAGLPGQAPFTRGPAAARDRYLAWDIRQPIGGPDAAQANTLALKDLNCGVSSVELLVGGTARPGLSVDGLSRALAGVMLDLAPVALSAGRQGLSAARALLAHFEAAQANPAEAAPAFNIDPLGAWMRAGGLDDSAEASIAAAAAFATGPGRVWTKGTSLRANGRALHEAGASPAWELAGMLSAGVTYLRALEAANLSVEDAGAAILFSLAVGPDTIVEIAKLRAARTLWAEVMAACGAAPAARNIKLQAITSLRMMTRYDPWTNILRGTAACFAAAAGGADVITVLPFTAPLGEASALARRMARNTQLILMEESGLGRVADPAGGAFAVESLSADMATAAWAIFQEIEAAGGLVAALRAGLVQKAVTETRTAAQKDFARRKQTITGLSDFPLLDEITPEVAAAAIAPSPSTPPASDPIEPLAWMRWAAPLETLRDKAEAKNPRPTVFFANLGPLAEFSARASFAQNLFAVGGVGAIGADVLYTDDTARIAAFTASGASVAVLTGSDARYASEAAGAAQSLKAAGATWLIYAGKPADEAALRAAGVDQFVMAGQDALGAIETLHAALGISS